MSAEKLTESTTVERWRAAMNGTWQPTPRLRFREHGDKGMLLEQLFVCISVGEAGRTEWRSVPVVPESQA